MEIIENIKDYGEIKVYKTDKMPGICMLTVVGEIEGHDQLPSNAKATKYEHILPKLAEVELDDDIDGLLILLNTMGGDVEAGLAIAEMIASLSKPTVSLVLGGSHSIGVPIAVSTDYSFIVPTGTMVIHPVRVNGTVIGAKQTYDYFQMIQDRIVRFISGHCDVTEEHLTKLMMATQNLSKDIGTILVGEETVKNGIINEIGGLSKAFDKLYSFIEKHKEK